MMKVFVYPTVIINFASDNDVPDCQVTHRDLERRPQSMSPATLEVLYNLLFSSIDLVSVESLLELYGVKKSNIAKF